MSKVLIGANEMMSPLHNEFELGGGKATAADLGVIGIALTAPGELVGLLLGPKMGNGKHSRQRVCRPDLQSTI